MYVSVFIVVQVSLSVVVLIFGGMVRCVRLKMIYEIIVDTTTPSTRIFMIIDDYTSW